LPTTSCKADTGEQGAEAIATYDDAIQVITKEIVERSGFSPPYEVKAIPFLSVNSPYEVGSVFLADYWPMRYSDRCVLPDSDVSDTERSIAITSDKGRDFNLSAGIPATIAKLISQLAGVNASIGTVQTGKVGVQVVGSTEPKTIERNLNDCSIGDHEGKKGFSMATHT
jgi:hypothetical protein